MGKLRHILMICLMLVMTSCEGLFYIDNVGNPIRFGISQQYYPKTRTSYSEEYDGRIEWSDGDEVSIYMTWDGDDYYGNPESANYNVSLTTNSDRLSFGKLSPVDKSLKWHGYYKDGRAWEYEHTFYSAYPPTKLENWKFNFYLSTKQDNMGVDDAPLAAYSNSSNRVDNDGGIVYLEYYPMFTTFCITIQNDLDEPIETITLKSDSDSKKLTGNYSVSVKDGSFGFNEYKGSNSGEVIRTVNVGSGKTEKNILLFIIPQRFEANELYFLLNSSETKRYIPEPIEAYHKYNINITVSKEEPEVDGPFSSFVNGVILAEVHKKWINWQWGDPTKNPPEDPKKIYGPYEIEVDYGWMDENGVWHPNIQKQTTWGEIPAELLWEVINSIVDLDVQGTWEMGETITPEDLNLFPNLQTVKLSGYYKNVEINNPQITEIEISTSEGDCVFNIYGCDALETLNIHEGKDVTVKGNKKLTELNIDSNNISDFVLDDCDALTTFDIKANNCIKNIEIKGNEKLENFTMSGPSNSGVNITCDSCPVLEWFSLTGGEGWNFSWHKDIRNCPKFNNSKVNVPGGIEN